MMKQMLGTGISCALLLTTLLAVSPLRPECPDTLVCFTIAEARNIDLRLIELAEEVAVLKARRLKPLGLCVGSSVGVNLDSEVHLQWLSAMYGWRF